MKLIIYLGKNKNDCIICSNWVYDFNQKFKIVIIRIEIPINKIRRESLIATLSQ